MGRSPWGMGFLEKWHDMIYNLAINKREVITDE